MSVSSILLKPFFSMMMKEQLCPQPFLHRMWYVTNAFLIFGSMLPPNFCRWVRKRNLRKTKAFIFTNYKF